MNDRLTTPDAAKRLGVSARTLGRWRREGVGPAYNRMEGRIWYTTADLEKYLKSLKVTR